MMNKVILIGRLGRDPEVRQFSNGNTIATLKVITNNAWRDKTTGDMKEKSHTHTIVVQSERVATRLKESLRKGHMVSIEGALEHRKWTDGEGRDHYVSEIIVRPYQGTVRKMPVLNREEKDRLTDKSPVDDAPQSLAVMEMEASPSTPEIDFFADGGFGEDDSLF